MTDPYYDRKILDLQRRYDEQYGRIENIKIQIEEVQSQIRSIRQVYHSATEAEQKEFMKAFIERIELFPGKRKDGNWIKKIVFNSPVSVDGEKVKELPLKTEKTVDTVVLLSKGEIDSKKVRVEFAPEEPEISGF